MLTENHMSVKILSNAYYWSEVFKFQRNNSFGTKLSKEIVPEKYTEIAIKKAQEFFDNSEGDSKKYWNSIVNLVFKLIPINLDNNICSDIDNFPFSPFYKKGNYQKYTQYASPYDHAFYFGLEWNKSVSREDRLEMLNSEINKFTENMAKEDSNLFINLKDTCIKYIRKNSTVFADQLKTLPIELQEKITDVKLG